MTPLWQGSGDDTTAPRTDTPDDPTVDQKAPMVAAITPGKGAKRLKVGVRVHARFSEPVRREGLTSSTVRLLPDQNPATPFLQKASWTFPTN